MRRRDDAEWLLEHELALSVRCPEVKCDARPGENCRNVLDGSPVEAQPAHWRRIKNAGGSR